MLDRIYADHDVHIHTMYVHIWTSEAMATAVQNKMYLVLEVEKSGALGKIISRLLVRWKNSWVSPQFPLAPLSRVQT